MLVTLLLVGLALFGPHPARAEPLELNAENMLRLSVLMLEQHRPAEALAMAEALIARDPGDARALAVKSRAERDLGRYAEATASARAAWKAADTAGQRYDAAMAVAQALASGGAKYRAQLWLRRAMEAAPDAAAKRAAERDFRYVRTRSRLWLRFSASVRPSSNVNNGSSSEILWFYGLPLVLSGDAQALSGIEGETTFTLRYRLRENETSKTDFRLGVVQTFVSLSDEAERKAPGASGLDYAYAAIEAGVDHAWRPFKGGEATVAATLGHSWYGGDPMAEYAQLEFGLSKTMDARTTLRGSLGVEHQNRLDSATRSSDSTTLKFGVTRRLAAGDRLEVMLSGRKTASDSDEIDHSSARLRLDWDRAKPVLGAGLSLSLWAETRNYDQSRYSADGRDDLTLGGEISLAFEKVDYMGFIPVMTLGAVRTDSNISLFDSETLGVGFSIRSKF